MSTSVESSGALIVTTEVNTSALDSIRVISRTIKHQSKIGITITINHEFIRDKSVSCQIISAMKAHIFGIKRRNYVAVIFGFEIAATRLGAMSGDVFSRQNARGTPYGRATLARAVSHSDRAMERRRLIYGRALRHSPPPLDRPRSQYANTSATEPQRSFRPCPARIQTRGFGPPKTLARDF